MSTTIGHRIHLLRKEKGLSQEELAVKIHVGKSTVSQYETGRRIPSDDIKKLLANLFNVTVDYLIGNSDERNSVNVYGFASSLRGVDHDAYIYFLELHQKGVICIGQAQAIFMKNAAVKDKIFFNCIDPVDIIDLFKAYMFMCEKEVPKHPYWDSSWYRIEYIELPQSIISVRKNDGNHSLIYLNAKVFPLPKTAQEAELSAFGGPALPPSYSSPIPLHLAQEKAQVAAYGSGKATVDPEGSYDDLKKARRNKKSEN